MGTQLSTEIDKNKEIIFKLHDEKHIITLNDITTQKITPTTSLLTYLRDIIELRDTKVMCREGGCGACVVTVTLPNQPHNRRKTISVNACLTPVLACHNWEIQTCHGIGNRTQGYHPIQVSLAQHKGSQCGFCSSGMVMNMYALTESRDMLTMQEIEDSFGGNMCRCTGYRPIMDAFKSLASDADSDLKNKYPMFPDIEDLKICKMTKKPCESMCEKEEIVPLYFHLAEDMHWYKARTIQNILDFFRQIGNATYRLVAGNTGQGVYKIINPPKFWVDIRSVRELLVYKIDTNLVLGANITLTDAMELFVKLSEENNKFWYLKQVRDHINLVAHVPVRNVGTFAGNLTLKHDHHEFPSDIFILLEALNAQITIVKESGREVTKSITEYFNFDMYKCVLKNIILQPIKKTDYLFQSYKIMPRAQNAHAYVNAAFLIEHNNFKVRSANIVYGGINPNFIHATKTEKYLVGKNLFDNLVLQGALDTLTDEIKPDYVPPESSPDFRKNLARNLYYKFILANAPKNKLNPQYESGGTQLQHELLTGVQLFQTDKNEYPVTEPVDKLEAMIQCSGEAKYIDDMPAIPGEVFGYFILAEAAPFTKVLKVDTTEAMKMAGVIDYVNYKDIPGENAFTNPILNPTEERLFCEDTIEYNGQPLGVIVADTWEHAQAAALKVKIFYSDHENHKPEYTIESILDDKDISRIKEVSNIKPKRKGGDIKQVLKGKYVLPGQYHYHMETQRCVCVPTEDGGYDIHASTQWMDQEQISASRILNMNMDKINVIVRRLGGAFGAKILRGSVVNIACVVTTHKVKKPVRLILPIDINMKSIGKRFATYCEYEVGIDANGVIQYLDGNVYQAVGLSGTNESLVNVLLNYIVNTYVPDTYNISCNIVQTDMAGNGFCRSPCSFEAIGYIENIMDHIAYATGKSQVEVRTANLLTTTPDMKNVLMETTQWAEYDKRVKAVQEFNENNRWMKKGLSFTIMNFSSEFKGPQNVLISIYAGDGTVAITHSGIECGQGINTKVVQVCAQQFGIPMDMISIKQSNTLTSPNAFTTGGSITSEAVCYATLKACKTILDRLAPVRAQMGNPKWPELILKAQQQQIELSTTGFFTVSDVQNYLIPGACVCEVQVDLLTGEYVLQRVDLLEDVGRSISPSIDAGQIEGAFIMGAGNYTCENLLYGDQGELLTYNTWNYKIPGVKDVPQDFRIMFKRDSTNPVGVLNSKATAEPATCLSVGVPIAIRQALLNAKEEDPKNTSFIDIDGPFTVEYVLLHSSSNYQNYTL